MTETGATNGGKMRDRLSINASTTRKEKEFIVNTFKRHRINMAGWVVDRLMEKAEALVKSEDLKDEG